MAIVRRRVKLTASDANHLFEQTKNIMNVMFDCLDRNADGVADFESRLKFNKDMIELVGSDIVKPLGKPSVILRQYESSPGIWVFDDTDSGMAFIVCSDGYKKNPWKGTSYYVIGVDGREGQLEDAFNRMTGFLRGKAAPVVDDKEERGMRM